MDQYARERYRLRFLQMQHLNAYSGPTNARRPNTSINVKKLPVMKRRQIKKLNVSKTKANVKQLPLIKRRQIKNLNVSKIKANVKQLPVMKRQQIKLFNVSKI